MSKHRWLPAWVLDLLDIHPSDSVLEVGSGLGLGLQLAAARAYQGNVVDVDPSETMLEMARRRNRAQIEAGRIAIAITCFSYASSAKFESDLISAGVIDVSMHTGESGVCAIGCA